MFLPAQSYSRHRLFSIRNLLYFSLLVSDRAGIMATPPPGAADGADTPTALATIRAALLSTPANGLWNMVVAGFDDIHSTLRVEDAIVGGNAEIPGPDLP